MDRIRRLWRRPVGRIIAAAALVAGLSVGAQPALRGVPVARAATSGCDLDSAHGAIQHVIYIQFDNTHFTRDNPNVPSDLEQMPHLLNFIEGNGTLLANHHTPLIAHTATDILTSLTGLYGDHHGVPISNSFRYFNPDGTTNLGVSFAYWTDPLYDPSPAPPTDTRPNMLSADGKNAPAPWVPYTRAGCNVGAVATANTVLENISTDIPTVFGANSPQEAEVKSNPNLATADFVGIAVHCARGAALCANGQTDALPDEPGGYTGYKALFGHKYVAPQLNPGGPLADLNGNPITNTQAMTYGFPGFDGMSASVSLGYVAAMQEHGVPVTYAYISDAHDNHVTGTAFGPGEAGYVAQLKAYDDAFGRFFTRLAGDGINASNTLFVFTADEGDHFVGGAPSPANCDGVTTPCVYSHVTCDGTATPCPSNNVGELGGDLTGLLATQQGITTPFKVHADSAPNIYITGNPAPDAAATRAFERALAKLTAVNLLTGKTERITNYLADPVEMKLLHMVTADPARTPTLTMFAKPDYYLSTPAPTCTALCVTQNPGSAWNHGDVSPDINTTWLGLVGPGVRKMGVNHSVWSDHTDIRPTMLALVGLKDDYDADHDGHDGRVLLEVLHPWALPAALTAHADTVTELAQVYKQINAPVGALGLASLRISTKALESNADGDSTYTWLEGRLKAITAQRDALAYTMGDMLDDAAFNGEAINEDRAEALIERGDALLGRVETLAANS